MTFDWNAYADSWDEDPAVRTYADRAHRALFDVISPENLRILDFGCGTGLLTEKMAPSASHVVALDPSPEMIRRLKSKSLPGVQTRAQSLTPELIANDPAFAARFDLVTASSVCAFVPDYPATLALLHSLLAKDGRLVQWDWLRVEDEPGIGFTETEITTALSAAGFRCIVVTQPFSNEGPNGVDPVLMAVARR